MPNPRYNLGSLLDLIAHVVFNCSFIGAAENVALAAEEYVLRKISLDIRYELKKARLLERVRGVLHIVN